ncbi:MAG: PAS domain S-box protein [Cyclobacteriaceae bacterium]
MENNEALEKGAFLIEGGAKPISVCSIETTTPTVTVSKYFSNIFSTEGWPARWYCGTWSEMDGWVHILSDLSIFLAYFSIPIFLVFYLKKKKGVLRFRNLLILFSLFIFTCGATHFIEAVIFWEPFYRLSGVMKFVTASISWVTVFALVKAAPTVLSFKDPAELAKEVGERKKAQNQLQTFIKHAPSAIAMFDREMRYIMASDNWYVDYGLSEKEIVGRSHYEIFPQILKNDVWIEHHQKAQNGETIKVEKDSMITESGAKIYVRYEIKPWFDENDEIAGIIMFTQNITSQVLLQEELAQNQVHLKNIYDNSPIGIAMVDETGMPFMVNHRFSEIVGYEEKEIVNMTFAEFTHPDDVSKDLSLFKELKEGKIDQYSINKRYVSEWGEISHVKLNVKEIPGTENQKNFTLALVENITEEVKLQHRLEQNQHYLKNIFEYSPLGIAMIDESGVPFLVNAKYCDLTGYSASEITSMKFTEFTHPDDAPRDLKMFKSMVEGELEHYTLTKRYVRSDNQICYAKLNLKRIDNENGKTSHFLALAENVTDEVLTKREKAEVQKKADQLDALFQETSSVARIGTWLLNIEEQTVHWSKTVCEIHEVQEDSLIKLSEGINFYHPDDRETISKLVNNAIEKQEPWDVDLRIITATGKEKWVRAIGKPHTDGITTTHLSGLFQDIDEVKRASLQLAHYSRNLEDTVLQRTKQLQNVNKELESFAYSVSHDLRAPLRAINGFASALEDEFYDQLPDNARHYLGRISSNSNRMGVLIDDLLNFSRLSRLKTNFDSFDLNDRVDAVINQIDIPKSCKISRENLGEIYGDKSLLEQVFQNLISNAVKYSMDREEQLIKIEQQEKDANYIISISDNGVGFNMEYYNKLFEMFQRLHSSSEFEGTGVGLALCKKIIDRHDGEIWAESEINKGSTFYISLPKQLK